jgi:hypothetical protein
MALLLALLVQAEFIDKLRSDDIAVRDAAERELLKLGEPALPALKKALEAEKEAEPRVRLASVVAKTEKPRRHGRGSKDWSIRLEFTAPMRLPGELFDEGICPGDCQARDGGARTVELRGDGTGVAANGREVWVLSPTRAQLDAIAELALEAELLDYSGEEPSKAGGLLFEGATLTFVSGRERRDVGVWLRPAQPKSLAAVSRAVKRALDKPAAFAGEGVESLIDALGGKDAERAERLLKSAGAAVAAHLKEAWPASDAIRERIARLLEEMPK